MSRASVRARVEAATPGPWKKRLPGWLGPDRHKWGCVFFGPSPDEPYTTSPLVPADAAFIAHARTDIPALLAVADAAAAAYDPLDDGDFYRWQKNLDAALAALEAQP